MYGDPLTPLERDVIATLVGSGGPVMEGLRAQLAVCRIKSRELTGHGFFTEVVVPQRLAVAGIGRLVLDGVHAALNGVQHGAGFVLFVEDGMLATLEGFTFDEPWPAHIDRYALLGTSVQASLPGDEAGAQESG